MREDSVNLGEIATSAAAGAGVVWALRRSSELNANLVCFGVGGGVGEHVNAEVDVILVDVSGSSRWKVKSIPYRRPMTFVPRGARRSISAASGDFACLSVHRRRGPLQIGG